jgi:hypothetical protein
VEIARRPVQPAVAHVGLIPRDHQAPGLAQHARDRGILAVQHHVRTKEGDAAEGGRGHRAQRVQRAVVLTRRALDELAGIAQLPVDAGDAPGQLIIRLQALAKEIAGVTGDVGQVGASFSTNHGGSEAQPGADVERPWRRAERLADHDLVGAHIAQHPAYLLIQQIEIKVIVGQPVGLVLQQRQFATQLVALGGKLLDIGLDPDPAEDPVIALHGGKGEVARQHEGQRVEDHRAQRGPSLAMGHPAPRSASAHPLPGR